MHHIGIIDRLRKQNTKKKKGETFVEYILLSYLFISSRMDRTFRENEEEFWHASVHKKKGTLL